MPLSSHSSPFTRDYWRGALQDCKKPRILAFSALMIALCVGLSYVPSIPITAGVNITWGYLARALAGLVGGPLNALVFGFAEDTISFIIHPQGAYFPGYALTTMLGTMIYALFLYRRRITLLRIALAKLVNSVFNLFLGSLWSMILYGKGYLYYVAKRLMTYAFSLPVQVLLLYLLLAALVPILCRMNFHPRQGRVTLW